MATVDDIIKQRDATVGILSEQLIAANQHKNDGVAGMDDKITALLDQRAAIAAQAYEAALDDPALAAALAKLKAITKEMSDVAKRMVSATQFIANFAGFMAAAGKVVPTLKGLG